MLAGNPSGTILPLGSLTSGHKGFGLGLLVEALTGGLAGHGRADPADEWVPRIQNVRGPTALTFQH